MINNIDVTATISTLLSRGYSKGHITRNILLHKSRRYDPLIVIRNDIEKGYHVPLKLPRKGELGYNLRSENKKYYYTKPPSDSFNSYYYMLMVVLYGINVYYIPSLKRYFVHYVGDNLITKICCLLDVKRVDVEVNYLPSSLEINSDNNVVSFLRV